MYRSLVVPLDGSIFAEQALPVAGAIVKRSKASLMLVRVHQPIGYSEQAPIGEWEGDARQWESDYLTRAAEQMRERYGAKVETGLLDEPVVGALCEYVGAHGVDLVVMSTHGRTGVSRAWLGSVADGIVRRVSVPVLMLRARAEPPTASPDGSQNGDHLFDRILLPLDGSRSSEAIVGHAVRLARTFGSEIVLFRVVEPIIAKGPEYPLSSPVPITLVDRDTIEQLKESARKYLDGIARRLREEHGLRASIDVRMFESAAPAIIDATATHHVDVVAMATHGRGASRLLVGSVADKVLRGGPRAVLLFRPQQD
jgi:nucleotide-binding universal stress UspA family protein